MTDGLLIYGALSGIDAKFLGLIESCVTVDEDTIQHEAALGCWFPSNVSREQTQTPPLQGSIGPFGSLLATVSSPREAGHRGAPGRHRPAAVLCEAPWLLHRRPGLHWTPRSISM